MRLLQGIPACSAIPRGPCGPRSLFEMPPEVLKRMLSLNLLSGYAQAIAVAFCAGAKCRHGSLSYLLYALP